jgi:hypothetical protein
MYTLLLFFMMFTIPMIPIYRQKMVHEYSINKVIKSHGFDYQPQGFDYNHNYIIISFQTQSRRF